MNDTEITINKYSENLFSHLAGSFVFYLMCFLLSGVVTYLFFCTYNPGGKFFLINPINTETRYDAVRSAVAAVTPAAFSLVLLFISVFTVFYKPISIIVSVSRGISVGCAISFITRDIAYGISEVGLSMFFLSSAALFLLEAYSSVYSPCICSAYITKDRRALRKLSSEYLRCFLAISGAVFLSGIAAAILI